MGEHYCWLNKCRFKIGYKSISLCEMHTFTPSHKIYVDRRSIGITHSKRQRHPHLTFNINQIQQEKAVLKTSLVLKSNAFHKKITII